MLVRALLSFHTAPLPGHNQNLLSSIIPTLARLSRKSNHSRTYRTPQGEGVWSYQSNRLTAHQATTRNVFSFTSFTSPTSFTSRSPLPTFSPPAPTFTTNMSYTFPNTDHPHSF